MKEIRRSVSFAENTRWNYPLKRVEVLKEGEHFGILIYDVGHEPPFYDVTRLPSLIIAVSVPKTFDELEKVLRERGIFVQDWQDVDQLFLHECNAVIRSDIRADIEKLHGFEDNLPPVIDTETAREAIKELSQFSGHSARIKVLFLEQVARDPENMLEFFDPIYRMKSSVHEPGYTRSKLCSYVNYGYLMFRTPQTYEHWGIVAKGNYDDIAILLKAEDNFDCLLYDQMSRTNMIKGPITEVCIDIYTAEANYRLSPEGLFAINQKEGGI